MAKVDHADVDPEALQMMRERTLELDRWAAYRNEAMDSLTFGHIKFLVIGPVRTYTEAPKRYPNEWKYLHIGYVNLVTGEIEK